MMLMFSLPSLLVMLCAGVLSRLLFVVPSAHIYTHKKKNTFYNQVSLASRFDSYGNDPSGHVGRQWRADVEEKIEKWQELQTAKTKKSLPKPDDMPARKRGGKRYEHVFLRTHLVRSPGLLAWLVCASVDWSVGLVVGLRNGGWLGRWVGWLVSVALPKPDGMPVRKRGWEEVQECVCFCSCSVVGRVGLGWVGLGWVGLSFGFVLFGLVWFGLLCFALVRLGWVGLSFVWLGLPHGRWLVGWAVVLPNLNDKTTRKRSGNRYNMCFFIPAHGWLSFGSVKLVFVAWLVCTAAATAAVADTSQCECRSALQGRSVPLPLLLPVTSAAVTAVAAATAAAGTPAAVVAATAATYRRCLCRRCHLYTFNTVQTTPLPPLTLFALALPRRSVSA